MTTSTQQTSTIGSESSKTMAGNSQTALMKAVAGNSLMNYEAIFEGFKAKGIPDHDIQPRINIFTFAAWQQLGRVVKKGQHGIKVCTFIHAEAKQATDSKPAGFRVPRTTTVFHITQTELLPQ